MIRKTANGQTELVLQAINDNSARIDRISDTFISKNEYNVAHIALIERVARLEGIISSGSTIYRQDQDKMRDLIDKRFESLEKKIESIEGSTDERRTYALRLILGSFVALLSGGLLTWLGHILIH